MNATNPIAFVHKDDVPIEVTDVYGHADEWCAMSQELEFDLPVAADPDELTIAGGDHGPRRCMGVRRVRVRQLHRAAHAHDGCGRRVHRSAHVCGCATGAPQRCRAGLPGEGLRPLGPGGFPQPAPTVFVSRASPSFARCVRGLLTLKLKSRHLESRAKAAARSDI
jgi:hypothetical protein